MYNKVSSPCGVITDWILSKLQLWSSPIAPEACIFEKAAGQTQRDWSQITKVLVLVTLYAGSGTMVIQNGYPEVVWASGKWNQCDVLPVKRSNHDHCSMTDIFPNWQLTSVSYNRLDCAFLILIVHICITGKECERQNPGFGHLFGHFSLINQKTDYDTNLFWVVNRSMWLLLGLQSLLNRIPQCAGLGNRAALVRTSWITPVQKPERGTLDFRVDDKKISPVAGINQWAPWGILYW